MNESHEHQSFDGGSECLACLLADGDTDVRDCERCRTAHPTEQACEQVPA